jgi:hypothetical protein
VISFGETKPTRHLGLDLNFVPLESCNPGVGEFIPVPYNHMDICKPESKKSILFRCAYIPIEYSLSGLRIRILMDPRYLWKLDPDTDIVQPEFT